MRERFRLSYWRRFEAATIAWLTYPLIALLCRTLRWRVEGQYHFDSILHSGHQPIFAFWHGRILAATYYWRRRGIVVITSENFDGEWVARIIKRFGYEPARGSTSRGARRALIKLKRDMACGRSSAFTLDGPRGPAKSAQPGAIWLASVTGHPILPFHIEAKRYWTMRSWDRAQIPKPFSSVVVAIGAPIEVTREVDAGVLEGKRQELEEALDELDKHACEVLNQ